MSRNYVPRIQSTRAQLARQTPDAGFTAPPPTRQWSCGCGAVNPASRVRCRTCREPAAQGTQRKAGT